MPGVVGVAALPCPDTGHKSAVHLPQKAGICLQTDSGLASYPEDSPGSQGATPLMVGAGTRSR